LHWSVLLALMRAPLLLLVHFRVAFLLHILNCNIFSYMFMHAFVQAIAGIGPCCISGIFANVVAWALKCQLLL
jgi:hypothetical protein